MIDVDAPSWPETSTTSRQATGLARIGVAAWTVIGVVLAVAGVILGAISEIAIPVLLGAILAVVAKPVADAIIRRGLRPSAAAALVLGGLLVIVIGVGAATVSGLVEQQDEISASINAAVTDASNEFNVDSGTLTDAREAIDKLAPLIGAGTLTTLVTGVGSLVGFVSGLLLALIVLYYMVRDGTRLRGSVTDQIRPTNRAEFDDFIGESCHTLRSYAHGRTCLPSSPWSWESRQL